MSIKFLFVLFPRTFKIACSTCNEASYEDVYMLYVLDASDERYISTNIHVYKWI